MLKCHGRPYWFPLLVPEDLVAAGFSAEYADDLTRLVVKRAALAKKAGCAGVVCSDLEAAAVKEAFPYLVVVTPGIRPAWSIVPGDDQKRIVTPRQAIINGADYLVVGRPIRMAKDPERGSGKDGGRDRKQVKGPLGNDKIKLTDFTTLMDV